GAEGAAGAGDDDAAHSGILVDLEGGVKKIAPEAEVERVVRVRAIERDRRDAVAALEGQIPKVHGGRPPLSVQDRCAPRRPAPAPTSSTSLIRKGFTSTRSTPCARRSSADSSTPKPVTRITGTFGAISFTDCAICQPETRGIARSVNTTSKGSARNRSMASPPSLSTTPR